MQSTNHEQIDKTDKNQTPLPQDNAQESSTFFSSQKTRMDYVTLEGIENRTGVGKENLYGFMLKELCDNAIDFLESQSGQVRSKEGRPAAEVKVRITKEDNLLRFVVRNSNNYSEPTFSYVHVIAEGVWISTQCHKSRIRRT